MGDAVAYLDDHTLERLLDGAGIILRDMLLGIDPDDPSFPVEVVSPEAGQGIILRETADSSPALDTLQKVVSLIEDGGDLSTAQADVVRLILNQEERADLISSLMLTQDYRRLVRSAQTFERLEAALHQIARTNQLSPTQLLAFHKLIGDDMTETYARVRSGGRSVKDLTGLLNRINYAAHEDEEGLKRKFAKVNPQEREIVRRLAHKLVKLVSATKPDEVKD